MQVVAVRKSEDQYEKSSECVLTFTQLPYYCSGRHDKARDQVTCALLPAAPCPPSCPAACHPSPPAARVHVCSQSLRWNGSLRRSKCTQVASGSRRTALERLPCRALSLSSARTARGGSETCMRKRKRSRLRPRAGEDCLCADTGSRRSKFTTPPVMMLITAICVSDAIYMLSLSVSLYPCPCIRVWCALASSSLIVFRSDRFLSELVIVRCGSRPLCASSLSHLTPHAARNPATGMLLPAIAHVGPVCSASFCRPPPRA